MSDENGGSETPQPWWRRATWLFGALGAGGLIGLCSLMYNVGKDVGAGGVREQVESAKALGETGLARCERGAAKVEDDLRQCVQSNASLQAVLRLNEADRNKILDATIVVPSLRVTMDGRALSGSVRMNSRVTQNLNEANPEFRTQRCFEDRVWLENTSSRDVRIVSAELVAPEEWGAYTSDSVPLENDPSLVRNWLGLEVTLAPGQRHYLGIGLCSSRAKNREQLPATLTIYASGYLPLVATFTATPR